jgi:3'(2'), 5'-bisphosphate nucleotidase
MFYQKKEFIENFINLIKECNEIVLKIYNTDFSVITKSDNTPLTLADKKCNDHICNYLKANFKDILIISEENKEISYQDRKKYDMCWLIDPIDGTKEFVKRNGQFTVNIGLCKNGIPVFGIVSIPVSGEIYYGIDGIGSFKSVRTTGLSGTSPSLEPLDKKIELKIQKKNFTKEGLNIVASSSHLNDKTKKFIELFDKPNIVNTGSSIKLLWVAEGKADIYPRLAPTSEWDTCAAHAVVKYAGGKVLQYEKIDFTLLDKELEYNKENILNPYFIVY